MSQGHTGGRRAPARWTPVALRPQGHSHGVQLSLPLSKVHRSPRQVPAALSSRAGFPGRGGGSGAPAPHRAPQRGTPGSATAPSAAGARSWFRGAPLAGGVRATHASFLSSPCQSRRAAGGAVLHPCASRLQLWYLPEGARPAGCVSCRGASPDRTARSVPAGLAGGSAGLRGRRDPAGPGQGRACSAIAVVPVGPPAQPRPPPAPRSEQLLSLYGAVAGRSHLPVRLPEGTRRQPSPGDKGRAAEGACSHPLLHVPRVPRAPALPSPGGTAATPHCLRPRHLAVPPGGGRTLLPASRCCSRPAGCPWKRAGCSRVDVQPPARPGFLLCPAGPRSPGPAA